ncbi:hypothetical protein SB757_32175, partial [Pseudomonas sp. SIMBA_065]
KQEVTAIAEWQELTQQEQQTVFADLENLSISVSEDLIGLRKLVNQDYSIQNQLQEIKRNIKRPNFSLTQLSLYIVSKYLSPIS